jgi:hypothetical protein
MCVLRDHGVLAAAGAQDMEVPGWHEAPALGRLSAREHLLLAPGRPPTHDVHDVPLHSAAAGDRGRGIVEQRVERGIDSLAQSARHRRGESERRNVANRLHHSPLFRRRGSHLRAIHIQRYGDHQPVSGQIHRSNCQRIRTPCGGA